jgi:hypothetical protein
MNNSLPMYIQPHRIYPREANDVSRRMLEGPRQAHTFKPFPKLPPEPRFMIWDTWPSARLIQPVWHESAGRNADEYYAFTILRPAGPVYITKRRSQVEKYERGPF